MKKIIFYNHFHNGDIHVSRNFISKMCERIGFNEFVYYYTHNNDANLLEDIKYINYDKDLISGLNPYDLITKKEDNIYINTWFSSAGGRYIGAHAVTFDCLYFLFKDIYKEFNIDIETVFQNPKDILPNINYNNIDTNNIKKFISENKNNILISNGLAMSGQAVNFNLTEIILKLSLHHKDKKFILTNKEIDFDRVQHNNVMYSSEIIKKHSGSDLNEISYLSLFCDTIVGRASGPFTFAMVRENFDNSNKRMISFSDLDKSGIGNFYLREWGQKNIKYEAKVIQSQEKNTQEIYNIIENNI